MVSNEEKEKTELVWQSQGVNALVRRGALGALAECWGGMEAEAGLRRQSKICSLEILSTQGPRRKRSQQQASNRFPLKTFATLWCCLGLGAKRAKFLRDRDNPSQRIVQIKWNNFLKYIINPGEISKREIKGKEIGQGENKYQDVNASPILLVITLTVNRWLIPVRWQNLSA